MSGALRTPRRQSAQLIGAAALLALHYAMAVSAASQTSMTFDEMAHMTGGRAYWTFNDYRLHPENGNWPQRLAALPAVLSRASFPRVDQPAWTSSNVYVIGDQYLYSSGNDAQTLLIQSRSVMALISVALGALVYGWTRWLISPAGALVSLVLYAFSPTILANAPLATSDVTSALFFTAATGALWVAFHRVSAATVAGAALLSAGCFLSKVSGPILIVVALIMMIVRLMAGPPLILEFRGRTMEWRHRAKQLAVLLSVSCAIGLLVYGLIWASYGFRYTAFAAGVTGRDTFLGQVKDGSGLLGWLLATSRHLHLLPEAYLYSLDITVQYSTRAAFLNGRFGTTGWWWYFPYTFAVKTTLPALILGALALAGLITRWRRPGLPNDRESALASVYAGMPLLTLLLVYLAFAITSGLNIGHRHLLPIYPALFILTGGAAYWLEPLLSRFRAREPQAHYRQRRKAAIVRQGLQPSYTAIGAISLLLLAWHSEESVAIGPYHLSYMNQLAGGPTEGYMHLADSSLDWGQGLPALKAWLDAEGLQQPGAAPVYLSYFGTARPEYYGINAVPLAGFIDRRSPQPPAPLTAGVYCVSATVLDVIGRLFYQPESEANYQAAFKNLVTFARASEDDRAMAALIQRTGDAYWQQLFVQYDQLRTGRLTAYLRHRRPDAMAAYSILIYRLTDADLNEALNGPVPPA